MISQPLPSAVDFEEIVLGAIIIDGESIDMIADILRAEMFYSPVHQKIYSAIHRLYKKNEPVHLLTVANELKKSGDLEFVGGPYFISTLSNKISSSANIDFHARIIMQKFMQRQIICISSEGIQNAFDPKEDVFDTADNLMDSISKVIDIESIAEKGIEDVKSEVEKQIDEAAAAGGIVGEHTGLNPIDEITKGLRKEFLYIFAARPGMGKSALVKSIAKHISIKKRKRVLIFSLEMSAAKLIINLVSEMSSIDSSRIESGQLSPTERMRISDELSLIGNYLIIDDTPYISLRNIIKKTKRHHRKGELSAMMVDYVQLIGVEKEDRKIPREQQVSEISKGLKGLSRELKIPVIGLAQLSRDVEKRSPPRPILSDLRESGSLEQDADVVAFIYRPEYYGITEDANGVSLRGVAEVIFAKNRHGRIGSAILRFIPEFTKFENWKEENNYQN